MTARQRILSAIRREPTDRLVVAPFIFLNFVRKFFNDPDVDIVARTIDVYRHFGFDLIHRNARPRPGHVPPSGPNWDVSVSRTSGTDSAHEATEIRTPGGTLRQVMHFKENPNPFERNLSYLGNTTEYLFKSHDDFELYRTYAPPQHRLDLSDVTRSRTLVADDGIIAPWVQGVFNFATYFRSLEDLFSDPLEDAGFYGEMMAFFLERNTQIIRQYVEAGATVLSYGGNIASGQSVGPQIFREFVMPYEKELIRRIHDMGGMVLYHNCGFAASLYQAYSEMGMDLFETLTEPPFGDGDLGAAMATFAGKTALSGNLDQVKFLISARPDEVYERAARLTTKVKPYRHFIVAASDFFETDTPHENVAAFARAAIDNGGF